MTKRVGVDTIEFTSKPRICDFCAIVGPKEGDGPLGKEFDKVSKDDMLGEKTYELAESRLLIETVGCLLKKAKVVNKDIDMLISGDLVNQIMVTNFAARELGIPLIGVYGACATIAESLALGACLIDGGSARRVVSAASSHFGSAERQYRAPIEMGGIRTESSQWTVTGAGATLLCDPLHSARSVAEITHATFGRVVDYGINDATNMGAVMAPAAAQTLLTHLSDTGRSPEYYDLILTGDLATIGHNLFHELVRREGVTLDDKISKDCGMLMFSSDQKPNAGASGCGCSATILNSYILRMIEMGKLRKVAFIATGALLSAISTLQGETIPAVAHMISIEALC